jgi:hypothetical protein
MRYVARLGIVACLAVGFGCGKKVAKSTTPDTPEDEPKPVAKSTTKGTSKTRNQPTTTAGGGGGNTNTGGNVPAVVPSGAGGGVVLNPGAATGGGGGGSALGVVRKAAKRAATMNELNQIKIFIENASAVDGRIPDPKETLEVLRKEAPPIAAAVEEGVIVLHPAKSREEVWAYEGKALTEGGVAIINGTITRVRPEELREKLGIK